MEYYAVDPLIFHTVDPDPFADFPNNNGPQVKRIQVTEATRQRSLIDLATKDLRQGQLLILTAVGRDCSKTVTCVEILKTNCRTVHQITHINQMTTVEVFTPLIAQLDAIEVRRTVPMIHILLSREPFDGSSPGYQCQKNGKQSKKILSQSTLEAENTCDALSTLVLQGN